jgi:hypothetical protein
VPATATSPPGRQRVGGPYQVISHRDKSGGVDWAKVAALPEPERDTTIQPLPMSLWWAGGASGVVSLHALADEVRVVCWWAGICGGVG